VIIGKKPKKNLVEKTKYAGGLDNLTVLPFQPENVLPVSLPTADISIITLDKGCEGLSVASKIYYFIWLQALL
jgi:hypothetical protein